MFSNQSLSTRFGRKIVIKYSYYTTADLIIPTHVIPCLFGKAVPKTRRAESEERRAESGERRAESGERRAESGERSAECGV